eukprot:1925444-Pleurochrysis_carterae.AAC.1
MSKTRVQIESREKGGVVRARARGVKENREGGGCTSGHAIDLSNEKRQGRARVRILRDGTLVCVCVGEREPARQHPHLNMRERKGRQCSLCARMTVFAMCKNDSVRDVHE